MGGEDFGFQMGRMVWGGERGRDGDGDGDGGGCWGYLVWFQFAVGLVWVGLSTCVGYVFVKNCWLNLKFEGQRCEAERGKEGTWWWVMGEFFGRKGNTLPTYLGVSFDPLTSKPTKFCCIRGSVSISIILRPLKSEGLATELPPIIFGNSP